MAKSPKAKDELADIELLPDAWPRFERFVKDIVKAGPQHRPAKKDAEPKPRAPQPSSTPKPKQRTRKRLPQG